MLLKNYEFLHLIQNDYILYFFIIIIGEHFISLLVFDLLWYN